MKATLIFPNVEFTADSRATVRVRQGETFTLSMFKSQGDISAGSTWFSDNDPCLTTTPNPNSGLYVNAVSVGMSELQLQAKREPSSGDARTVHFVLVIDVYNYSEAATMNVNAGAPVPK
jgi:hypothetical protein